jgi:hypothetical protein
MIQVIQQMISGTINNKLLTNKEIFSIDKNNKNSWDIAIKA